MPRFAMRSPYCQSSWVCEYVWIELHRLHKFEAPQQALSWRVGELASAWSKLETFRGMDWSMPTLDILNSKEEVAKPKDPQLCRQINDYNLTISWNSGVTQFYNQCFLAFLGSVKKLCKVDFDPLCTFSYFLTILTISLPISSDLRYVSRESPPCALAARRWFHGHVAPPTEAAVWPEIECQNRLKMAFECFGMLGKTRTCEDMRRFPKLLRFHKCHEIWRLKDVSWRPGGG